MYLQMFDVENYLGIGGFQVLFKKENEIKQLTHPVVFFDEMKMR
jgi:hypothetical protein